LLENIKCFKENVEKYNFQLNKSLFENVDYYELKTMNFLAFSLIFEEIYKYLILGTSFPIYSRSRTNKKITVWKSLDIMLKHYYKHLQYFIIIAIIQVMVISHITVIGLSFD